MRLVQRSAAAVLVGAGLVASTVAVSAPAQAQVSHRAHARADWIKGSQVAAAVEAKYWRKASRELSHYGARYRTERQALATLVSIPLTDTTKKQRANAVRSTRALNAFFHTPGQYGVKPAASHRSKALADWKKSFVVSAAEQNRYLDAARRELKHYGKRYAHQVRQLAALADIPLTDTTAHQRAEAKHLLRSLNKFFGTHLG